MGEERERERERERDEERKRKKERDILHLVVIEAKFNTQLKKKYAEREQHNTFIRARTLARIRLHDVSFTIDKTVQIANLSRARALLDASRLPRRVRPPKFAR